MRFRGNVIMIDGEWFGVLDEDEKTMTLTPLRITMERLVIEKEEVQAKPTTNEKGYEEDD